MRIAILGSRGIPASHGGFETFAEGLATRLVDRGHVVTVYCEGRRAGRPRRFEGVHLVYLPVPARGCLRPLVYDLLSLLHASIGNDVVYLLGYGAALFGLIPRLLGRRLWINMDGLEWQRAKWSRWARAWFRRMEGVALRVSSLVVFDAQSVRDDVVARRGVPRRSTVLAYAADPRVGAPSARELAPYGLRKGRYHLVVCRLEPENHVIELIRGYVASAAVHPLVIVADYTRGSPYARQCLKAGDENVCWLGTIWDRTALESLRSGAFSYLHGHSVGGTNPSLLEAMAVGNVCLAHDNPFTREVLGEHALYFDSPEAVAAGIERLEAMDAHERQELAIAVRTRVSRNYSWDELVDGYEDALIQPRSIDARDVGTPAAATTPVAALERSGLDSKLQRGIDEREAA